MSKHKVRRGKPESKVNRCLGGGANLQFICSFVFVSHLADVLSVIDKTWKQNQTNIPQMQVNEPKNVNTHHISKGENNTERTHIKDMYSISDLPQSGWTQRPHFFVLSWSAEAAAKAVPGLHGGSRLQQLLHHGDVAVEGSFEERRLASAEDAHCLGKVVVPPKLCDVMSWFSNQQFVGKGELLMMKGNCRWIWVYGLKVSGALRRVLY